MSERAARRCVIAFSLAALLALTGAGIVRFWPRPPLVASIPSSVAVLDTEGRLLRLTLARDQQYRLWTPLPEIPRQLVDALLLHEDQYYYRHAGVNPVALVRAAATTYGGGTRQGASTITMQLARLLYRLDTRSWSGKMRQIVLAVGLELRYSKAELLEAHLNLLPYGGNIQGIGAASLVYFGKQPRELGLAENLALVVIPQSPARRTPLTATEPRALREARLRLYQRWTVAQPQARAEAESVRAELQYGSLRALPFEAPHAVDALLAEHAGTHAVIRSTLELPTQRVVERVVHNFVREREAVGVRNAAAILVDARDLHVRALVGSADFFDNTIAGQVNGTRARRSPGSALKPFVYALAIDQGLIHPLTVLKDAPTAFGPFSPENFDGQFAGPLTATEALVRSRNVPAVALAARLSQPSFYQFLQSAGVDQLESERHYGLALALGGGEVTMEEVAQLYALLANGGRMRPLQYIAGEAPHGTRLLSEEASFLALDMLARNPRPDDTSVKARGQWPASWKTGTSWGFRDAWSAGVLGPYVLVVWVGNFDGSSNPAFVGLNTAAPLFFRIADAVQAAQPHLPRIVRAPPGGLARIEVCAASGELPNADCPRTQETWFIPGKSPIRVSDVHRRVWIDTRTGRQACPPLDPAHSIAEVFEFWPSDVQELFAQAGLPRRRPPAPGTCTSMASSHGRAPQISSPLTQATYTIRMGRKETEHIPLVAHADGDVRRVHWFVDTAYVGSGSPESAMPWVPQRSGKFIVRAVDDRGRADSRELRVELLP
jgi:penicillin-binding protein 1C